MKKEIVKVNSGQLEKLTYDRNDAGTSAKRLIQDLYKSIQDFNSEIIFIQRVDPSEGNTIEDVIYEYMDKFHENGIVMADPIMLDNVHHQLSNNEMLHNIEVMRGHLFNNLFMQVFFSRRFSKYNRINSCFVYGNKDGHDFVENNKGDNKIIDRWESSSKII